MQDPLAKVKLSMWSIDTMDILKVSAVNLSFKMYLHGCHSSGNTEEKKFFKVREKSGNFTLSQGKLISLWNKSGKSEINL